MHIFVKPLTGKIFPLEVESFHKIYHVKGLIREKEGTCESDQTLFIESDKGIMEELEDAGSLANYDIHNDFTRRRTRGKAITFS